MSIRTPLCLTLAVLLLGGVARAEPHEVSLGSDESQVAIVRVAFPATHSVQELRVTTPTPRLVKIGTLTERAGVENKAGGFSPIFDVMAREDGTVVKIEGAGEAFFFVFTPGRAHASLDQIVTTPAADASAEARALERHAGFALFSTEAGIGGAATLHGAQLTADLFSKGPAEFISFSRIALTDRPHRCDLPAGEPVIILDARLANVSVLRADGSSKHCWLGAGSTALKAEDVFSTRRPEKLVFPALTAPAHWFDSDGWLEQVSTGVFPAVGQYRANFAKYEECAKKKWAELDPDGRAGSYDLVTYRGSKVVKVEAYAEKIRRKVQASCGWAKVDKERQTLKKDIAKTYVKSMKAHLAAIEARLAAFPR